MSTSPKPLPPAIEAAHRILAERGPLSAAEVKESLSSEGFAKSIESLAQLPDRFPQRFHLTADGLLSVASAATAEAGPESDDTHEDADWYRPTSLPRVPADRAAVLDIETTGLDPAKDFVCELALIRLDGTPLANVMVKLPEGVTRPRESLSAEFPLDDALRLLDAHLADIDLVVGHNLLEFDRPFLEKAAKRAGVEPPHLPPCVDSLHLATLFDVAMPNRSLADLTDRFEIVHPEAHRAAPDATATAAVVRALLDTIDVTDPSWQLAIGVLESFDHPLV